VGGWLNVHGSTGASAHALLVAQNDVGKPLFLPDRQIMLRNDDESLFVQSNKVKFSEVTATSAAS
jgi:hypothetical protein